MAHVIADRVKETTTTTGTGQLTLDGAVSGYVSFNDKMADTDTCFYCIDGGQTGQWEIGLGAYADTNLLTRTSVLSNSLGTTALVDFSAGTKDVFITHPAASLQRVKTGTFTYAIAGTTTAGTGTYDYGSTGYYTRVGDLVFFTVGTYHSAHTGTGNMKITGLPYKSKEWVEHVFPVKLRNVAFGGDNPFAVMPAQSGGTSEILLQYSVSNNVPASIALDTSAEITITGTYLTADPF